MSDGLSIDKDELYRQNEELRRDLNAALDGWNAATAQNAERTKGFDLIVFAKNNELRKLRAQNAELLEALKEARLYCPTARSLSEFGRDFALKVDAVIRKADGK